LARGHYIIIAMDVLVNPQPFPPEIHPVREWFVPTRHFQCMRAWRSADVGRAAEQRFEDLGVAYGCTVSRSTPAQDAQEHWDVLIVLPSTEGGARYQVDVKAMKKLERNDAVASMTHTYIELHGKGRDNAGWLYAGRADLIAFEKPQGFLLCHRQALKDFVLARVDRTDVGHTPGLAALNTVYHRNTADHDQVTLVALADLEAFPHLVLAEWHDQL
jgi:hypothetical protein